VLTTVHSNRTGLNACRLQCKITEEDLMRADFSAQ